MSEVSDSDSANKSETKAYQEADTAEVAELVTMLKTIKKVNSDHWKCLIKTLPSQKQNDNQPMRHTEQVKTDTILGSTVPIVIGNIKCNAFIDTDATRCCPSKNTIMPLGFQTQNICLM